MKEEPKDKGGRPVAQIDIDPSASNGTVYHGPLRHTPEDCPKRSAYIEELLAKRRRRNGAE